MGRLGSGIRHEPAAKLRFLPAGRWPDLPGGWQLREPRSAPDSTSGTTTYTPPSIAAISPQGAVSGSSGFTLTVTGSNFFPSSNIVWNGSQLQTTFVSGAELQASIPAGDVAAPGNAIISVSDTITKLGSVGSLAFIILPPGSGSTKIIPMNLAATNVAWDNLSQQLLVPVLSVDAQYPNSIVAINPATGAAIHVAQVQPDPNAFGVTDDGSYVYTGYEEANNITRLSLPNLDSPVSWTLPTDPEWGPLWAWDIHPEPGASQSIAADFAASNLSPPYAGNVTIYDGGVARPQTASRGLEEGGDLEWGANDAQLYVADCSTAACGFGTFDVTSSGVIFVQNQTISGSAPGPANPIGGRVHFDPTTGYLYGDNGGVYDPATSTTVGSYSASGFMSVDATLNRVFVLTEIAANPNGENSYEVESFDKAGFDLVGQLMLPDLIGTPTAFIRWGANGLAIVTYNSNASIFGLDSGPPGMLYIISDSKFVSAAAAPNKGAKAQRVGSNILSAQ